MARTRNGKPEYVKLEQRMVLLAWLNGHLGYESNRELLSDMKETSEGFDASGHSYIYHHLEGREDKVKIPLSALARYDDNIREYLRAMNSRRSSPIVLRYFQYLAVLYTEIFLDWYFRRRGEMVDSLNVFIEKRNAGKPAGELNEDRFSDQDLKKLAYWMATGSGKTLIMHINYRQFLHYNPLPLDNILLITPNEGLSEQHIGEMAASSIPARRFDLNESGLMTSGKDAVRVIEITKLVEEKRGGGVSVPVEAFEGNNLIFVDEGHKGSGGEAWRRFREALSETGFTFEYSATFGQALTAARNDRLTAEYGKAILFDYSYRYFHGDGYGKDFRILNLKEEATQDSTETLALGNLLSFYEQQRVFDEQAEALRPYNLERPLWVFVGSTVNAVYTDARQKRSDVLTVVRFLHHVLENRRGWIVKTIGKLMAGKTGLVTPDGQDVFEGKFDYLREAGLSPEAIYQDILAKVLCAPAGGGLHLCDIRGGAGELGLKASGGDEYFGLIYIGDTSTFKKLVEEDDSGIVLEEDSLTGSLFNSIHEPGTKLNILIGAKKFMEGWNSWRVSNMGLLNIGRNEGSEIIQLFGRGVRLRGKNFSLRRSSALDGQHPDHLEILETLNIFAVRANYMAQFREYLEREGVETDGFVQLPLFIEPNRKFFKKGLVVPRVPEECNFAAEADILLEPDPSIRVRVDMSLKVQALESVSEGLMASEARAGRERSIPAESLDLVDWEQVYLELIEYKNRRGLSNLVVRPAAPRRILATTDPVRLYTLVAEEEVVRPKSFAETALLKEAVTNILRKYMDCFYRASRERWDTKHMVYRPVDESDPNITFNRSHVGEREHGGYTLKINRSESALISTVKKLISEVDRLYREESGKLPRIHFDRHLYQPLLVEHGENVKITPPALNKSESQFVRDMKEYWVKEKNKSLANARVFLLRNLSRGKGIGFFEERGFYPDFILWVVESRKQHIVFVDPHGMLHADAYIHDEKARLHEVLPDLANEIGARSKRKDITLDSYIISATPFDILRKKYDDGKWDKEKFAGVHILFPERNGEYDYMKTIFQTRLKS
ncbi:MAG: restriction endonuclease subunit R [Deltaproteobacteria bacterium HGW-Deltaproteobacteria-21]|nr:MAG: restriction endonuclease subunit R [Deltaproteobacteria bacterium HGW-Deltaproteobacteria-21]